MGFKKLTDRGKTFIITTCSGNGNSLLSGSNKYRLNFSSDPENTIYTANPKNSKGDNITTNSELGKELINWFNTYCELYELDANIVAAQAYVESNYRLWYFPSPLAESSAQGIGQLLSSNIYDVAIGSEGIFNTISTLFTEEEKSRLTNGLVNPTSKTSYMYVNNEGGKETAYANRNQFFQNCIDNPDLMIKAQCKYLKGISILAGDNAASTLFGFNQGVSYIKPTFTETLKRAEPEALPKTNYDEGLKYINNIFKLLNNSFGYKIDFTFDTFKADVASSFIGNALTFEKSTRLSPNYVLGDLITTSTGIPNFPDTQEEFDKLKTYANVILEPLNTYFQIRFIVNSSYRNNAVNAKVGGVVSSQHKLAEAADIRVQTDDPNLLFSIFEEIVAKQLIPFDQIIYETKGNSILQKWMHISYNPKRNRRQPQLANLVNGSMKYSSYVA